MEFHVRSDRSKIMFIRVVVVPTSLDGIIEIEGGMFLFCFVLWFVTQNISPVQNSTSNKGTNDVYTIGHFI
jgi:hypothetical protein